MSCFECGSTDRIDIDGGKWSCGNPECRQFDVRGTRHRAPACDICGKRLPPYPGRGRPALRHRKCQEQHRREYLRDAKRRERG